MKSTIGMVIGWKFNHQQGMATEDGVITAFPGGIPSQSDQNTWTAEYEAWLVANPMKSEAELLVDLIKTDPKALAAFKAEMVK
jgi:hypothetical protein